MGKTKVADLVEILGAYAHHRRQQKQPLKGDDSYLIEAIEAMVKNVTMSKLIIKGLQAEVKRIKICLAKIHWIAKTGPFDQVRFSLVDSLALEGIRELDRDTPHH